MVQHVRSSFAGGCFHNAIHHGVYLRDEKEGAMVASTLKNGQVPHRISRSTLYNRQNRAQELWNLNSNSSIAIV